MRKELDKHYKAAKISAADKVKKTKIQINDIRNKLFNMDISQQMEIVLRYRIKILSIVAGFVALIALFIMSQEPLYLIVSLLTGLIAMTIDFFIEHSGISKRAWDYPTTHLSFRKVPIEVPILFFNCGVLVTLAFYFFSTQPMVMLISNPIIAGFSYVQIALFLIGAFFMLQYFTGTVKSLVFWALPISIALYLSYSEPWVLVMSIFPMYLDYYLEKRLVKSAHIKYDRYGEEVATNVAISYFPATLFILGVVAILLHLLTV
ncbi:hypothetical protein DRO29_06520 [Candidatus Bathyarchaeota archaeon]|nr:MAG: hypothetical protein DRO29_06520 [Candidatus Bathyarchaeota archaeon]